MKNNQAEQVAGALKKAADICLVTHIKPDGDALGSMLALRLALISLGKTVRVFCDAEIPDRFKFMPGAEEISAEPPVDGGKACGLFAALDCGDEGRMGAFLSAYKKAAVKVNIDHHHTNPKYGTFNLVAPAYASTCEIVFDLLPCLGAELTKDIAANLYVGLSADTGNFTHSNTTAETFRKAARLLDAGINFAEISYKINKEREFNRNRLIGEAINNIRLYAEGRVAVLMLSRAQLAECGCGLADTEGLIDYAVNIKGVVCAASIIEHNRNLYKVSFRSHGNVDVSISAGTFGGGGHRQAAGCMLSGSRESVTEKALKSLTDQLP